MRYRTAIFDRSLTDITNKTAKAYFNLADWQRIYQNAYQVNQLVNICKSLSTVFNTLTDPTITTFASVADFNTLIANIERTRVASLLTTTGLKTLKTNWVAGINEAAPDYSVVNDWERNIDLIYNNIGAASGYTGWVPNAGSPVRKHRAGHATTKAGLKRNNGYRRYA